MTKRLVIAMTFIVAAVSLALAIPIAFIVATDQREVFVSQLETDTLAAASLLSSEPSFEWANTAEAVAEQTGARVVIVDTERTLISDSDNSTLDRSFDRPEIDQAFAGFVSSDVRYSNTLGTDLRYVAAPIIQDYQIAAVVRLSLNESSVDQAIRSTQLWLTLFGISVTAAAALIAMLISRSIASPLNRLSVVAEKLPEDLSLRASETDGPDEVRKVARALNTTSVRLNGMLRRTQRVAADASHHLRTPLTSVRLRLEAISEISDDAAVRDEALAALSEVDRLNRRIDQILALAKSDVGSEGGVPIEIVDIVRRRVDAAEPIALDRDIQLSFEPPVSEAPVRVSAPPGFIERIVDELLGNALIYARSSIRVNVRATSDKVDITISDDGPGVADDEIDRLFERFNRGANAAPGGSGLGLALVRESAETLGGSISAENRAGSSPGFTVTVELPLLPD